MSEAAAPLPAERAARRPLSVELSLTWEVVAYVSFVIIGAGMRFWDLGARALHHDESLHGFFAYDLFQGNGYEHDPLMHGPFQFFGTALTFFLTGGASDYTVRIFPALFGVALIMLPFFFRHRLGQLGALFASGLIAFSPTLLYFSRFARNDIYVAAFTLGIVITLWRYIDERKPLFLYLGAALLGLSFATKENTFINVALLLVFLNLWLAADLARQSREQLGMDRVSSGVVYLFLYLPYAWAWAALWPFIRGFRERLGLRELHPAGDFLIVLGTLSLPQLAAVIQRGLEGFFHWLDDAGIPLAWLGFDFNTGLFPGWFQDILIWFSNRLNFGDDAEIAIQTNQGAIAVVPVLLAATAVVGLRWNWRMWLLVAAAFYLPYTLLYTSFGTDPEGFTGGIWGSLDYWLDQHDVRRGDQPDFYYVMLLPAYEFLALAFAGPALLYFTLRGGPRSWLLTAVAALSLLAFFGADSFSSTLGGVGIIGETVGNIPLIGDDIAGTKMGDATKLTLPVAAVALYFAVRGSPFERFLVFWTASAIVAYSWVGEKMPWLSVHTTLPVVILAAYSLGRLLSSRPSDIGARLAPYLRPVAAAAFGALAVGLGVFAPDEGTAGVLRLVGIALAVAAIVGVLLPPGRQRLASVAAFAVFGALALFSVRAAALASFGHGDFPGENGDVPREMLVYTQTSPQVPDVMERIERIARTSGRGTDLPVVVDTTYTWPWAWYLRDYNITYDSIGDGFSPPKDAVLLIARENERKVEPFLYRYQDPEPYRLRWWFPETYREIGRDNLWDAGTDFFGNLLPVALRTPDALPISLPFAPEEWEDRSAWGDWWRRFRDKDSWSVPDTWDTWWRFFRDREHPQGLDSVYSAAVWSSAYFPLIYDPAAAPDVEGRLIIGRGGDAPGAFSGPSGLAVDSEGNLYALDSGNGRIQKFSPEGLFLKVTGTTGGGEGEFDQPGDLALDGQGNVYVVDTWNHRVQKFDADLQFIAAWGKPTRDLLNPGPDEMWGPRSIAVDSEGNIWVVDTGTHRVRKFSPEGEPLAALGGWGQDPGQFREPVGITFDSTQGHILVADAGNARIQRIDTELSPIAAYAIQEWQDLDPINKPDLAALPDGRILASDPAHGRIVLLDEAGQVVVALDSVAGAPLAFPQGLAYDAARQFVFVSEVTANQVRRFPLSDFAFR